MATAKGIIEKKTIDEAAEVKTKPAKSPVKKKTNTTANEKTKPGAQTVKKKASPKTAKKNGSEKVFFQRKRQTEF